jgi:hypothetical protein
MGKVGGRITKPWPWVGGRPYVGRAPRRPLALEAKLSLKLQIELVYDPGCPNVDQAREILTECCRDAGIPAVWSEWSSDDPSCPAYARNLGSPSVLVNGEDVAPGPHPWAKREPDDGPRCRVYRDGDAIVRAPPKSRVSAAIEEALKPDVG